MTLTSIGLSLVTLLKLIASEATVRRRLSTITLSLYL